jgi:hypothetical protein
MLIASLDQTVVGTSLPKIVGDPVLNDTDHPDMSGLDNLIIEHLESYGPGPNGERGASSAPGLQRWYRINVPNGGELSGKFMDGAADHCSC